MTYNASLTDLSDLELLSTVKTLVADERQATAQLIAALAELDARRLYLGEGCSSLFAYCTQVLHLSEHAAYGRIEAARAARRFPVDPQPAGRRINHADDGELVVATPERGEPSRCFSSRRVTRAGARSR